MKLNINPVLKKELKVKMRGWKSVITVTIYLAIIVLVAALVLLTMEGDPYSLTIDSGRTMRIYTFLAAIQFGLIMFIAPALTAGSISGEREKQTLDLLLSTRLRSWSVISGKLISSISHVILLIAASLPVFSIVFVYGGISIAEVLQLAGFYIVTAITLGSIGIFFSTFFKRTSISNVASYGLIGIMSLGTLIGIAMYMSYYMRWHNTPYDGVPLLMYTNPLAGFASLISEQFGTGGYNILAYLGLGGGYSTNAKAMALWKGNLIFNVCFTILLVALSAMKINPVKRNIFKAIKASVSRISFKKKIVNQE